MLCDELYFGFTWPNDLLYFGFRWPGNSTSIGMSSRSGPQGGISSPMFATNNIQGMSGMGVGMSMGAFSGGDRFDAYKQPYFKGP